MFGLYETAFGALTWGNIVMFLIGGALIYLGIAKKMEPVLLVPIGVGVFMVNLPFAGLMIYSPEGFPAEVGALSELISAIGEGKIGLLNVLYTYGIESEVIPLLIFLGVGAMTDFRPTIARPISFLFGATAQLGVFIVFFVAYASGLFTPNEAACVGIISASVTMLSIIAVPAMIRRGYSKSLASGASCAGGTLGILIPPSVMLIFYGPMAELSVGKLFMSAFPAGLVLSALYCTYIVVRCFLQPKIAPSVPQEEIEAVSFLRKTVMF